MGWIEFHAVLGDFQSDFFLLVVLPMSLCSIDRHPQSSPAKVWIHAVPFPAVPSTRMLATSVGNQIVYWSVPTEKKSNSIDGPRVCFQNKLLAENIFMTKFFFVSGKLLVFIRF